MRELRLILFFVVGLALGGGSAFAFAATTTASGMRFDFRVKAPSDVPVSASYDAVVPGTDWTYDSYSSPDATVRNSVNAKIGGKTAAMSAARTIAGSSLARIAVGLARVGGPLQLGMTLAPLIYNELAEQWTVPSQEVPPDGEMYRIGTSSNLDYTLSDSKEFTCQLLVSTVYVDGSGTGRVEGDSCKHDYASWFSTNGTLRGSSPIVAVPACPDGSVPQGDYCYAGERPATDQEIQDQIYVQLVASGMGSDLARRLVAAGYVPDMTAAAGPVQMSGPSSLPGDTSTSTTSSPAGMTTTTTTNNYNISYAGDTVTVTKNSSVTTTAADGSQSTTTTGTTPSGDDSGSAPAPERPKPFCEENPDSIACQSMDVPAEVKPDPLEKTFSITPTGGFGGAGSCPADAQLSFLGQPLSWSFKPACDFFSGVRPAVVAMAWVAAILIALGGYRKGD